MKPFALSMIFVRRPKGVGKKQGCGVLTFVVLLSDKDRLSTGAIEPVRGIVGEYGESSGALVLATGGSVRHPD